MVNITFKNCNLITKDIKGDTVIFDNERTLVVLDTYQAKNVINAFHATSLNHYIRTEFINDNCFYVTLKQNVVKIKIRLTHGLMKDFGLCPQDLINDNWPGFIDHLPNLLFLIVELTDAMFYLTS